MSRSSTSTSSSPSASSAIPFLQCDSKGKFQMMPEAVKILSKIKTKICPVVVAGPYRSGKSSLLNLVLNRNVQGGASGFAVGGTVNACTKGLWLWAEPLVVGDCTYVFIDSEGLGSTDQNAQFDTEVFSLSILLSSLFVLNTAGTINEGTLEQLELVVQMTERIRSGKEGKKGEQESLSELAQFCPSFLWVLRDFSLALENTRGDAITSNDYLEEALRPVSLGSNAKKGAQEKNRIRTAISTVFPNRHCVTMVRPVVEESDLKKVSQMPVSSLRPEFRQQLEMVKQLIYQFAQPKAVEGIQLSGKAYVSLAQNYVNAINSGSIPTIRTAFQSVQEIQSREAMDHALDAAKKSLTSLEAKVDKEALSEENLDAALLAIETSSTVLIREEALGDDKDLTQLCRHFTATYLVSLFTAVRERNKSRAEKSFQATAEELWNDAQIEGHLHTYTTYKQLNSDVSGYWAKYIKLTQGKGPTAIQIEVGRNFLDKRREVIFRFLFDKISTISTELEKSQAASEANQKEISKLRDELQSTRQEHQLDRKKFELESNQTNKDLQRIQQQQQETEKKLHASEERARKERTQLEQQSNESSKTLNQQISSLQTQVASLQSSLTSTESELKHINKEKSRLEKVADSASKNSIAAAEDRRQLTATQAELQSANAAKQKIESEHHALQQKYTSFGSQLKQINDEHESTVQLKEVRIRQLENEVAQAALLTRQVDSQAKEILQLKQQLQQAQQKAANAAAASAFGSNPLGLPPPTSEPLVSRSRPSLLPSSFQSSPPAASSASSGRKSAAKRKSEVVVEEDQDFDMAADGPAGGDDDDDSESDTESAARPSASAVASASRASLMSQPVRDPSSLSINELKSWLTSMDVSFPQKAQPKQFYVDLIYSSPAAAQVEAQFPKGQAKKKGKK